MILQLWKYNLYAYLIKATNNIQRISIHLSWKFARSISLTMAWHICKCCLQNSLLPSALCLARFIIPDRNVGRADIVWDMQSGSNANNILYVRQHSQNDTKELTDRQIYWLTHSPTSRIKSDINNQQKHMYCLIIVKPHTVCNSTGHQVCVGVHTQNRSWFKCRFKQLQRILLFACLFEYQVSLIIFIIVIFIGIFIWADRHRNWYVAFRQYVTHTLWCIATIWSCNNFDLMLRESDS